MDSTHRLDLTKHDPPPARPEEPPLEEAFRVLWMMPEDAGSPMEEPAGRRK